MHKIGILSSSVRNGRNSHRVALFFEKLIRSKQLAEVEIIDLHKYDFPIFHERLVYQKDPIPSAIEFSEKIKSKNGILIVTPEYNGGYPAALKNAIDLLTSEWKKKPVAISTVSSGAFGGTQVLTSLQFSLFKIGVLSVPAMFPVPEVDKNFDEEGNPGEVEKTTKRAEKFIGELIWCMDAVASLTHK